VLDATIDYATKVTWRHRSVTDWCLLHQSRPWPLRPRRGLGNVINVSRKRENLNMYNSRMPIMGVVNLQLHM